MSKIERSGLQSAARFAIQPNMRNYCGDKESSQSILRQCLTQPHFEPRIVKETLNSHDFPHLIAFLETIAAISGQDPFSDEVVRSYWLGNSLTETTMGNGKKLLIAQYAKSFLPEFTHELEKNLPDNIPLTHLTQVAFIAAADYQESQRTQLINQCMIAGGKVISINLANRRAIVNRDTLKSSQGLEYQVISRDQKVRIDLDLTPNLNIGDNVAVHLGYIAGVLTAEEASVLNKWTTIVAPKI